MVKNYFDKPEIEKRSPDELTSRAERLILDSASTTSNGSDLKGKASTAPVPLGGVECTVKNLYQDKRGGWTDKYPAFVNKPPENEQTSRVALIVRNKRSMDSRKRFDVDSIVVQSRLLKRSLASIFAGYPGFTTDVDRLEFTAPFQPFVYRWHQFEQATVNEKHLGTKQHLALLWNVLDSQLSHLLQKIKDYSRHGIMDYENIWTLFEPNCIIMGTKNGSERLYRCLGGTTNHEQCYQIEAQYVDWDGERGRYSLSSPS